MIIVDTREPDEYYKFLIERGLRVERRDIGFCDYIVVSDEYAVGIERKTPSDFTNSVLDGRIFNQAYMLSMVFPRSYILIEGFMFEAQSFSSFPRRAYIGALVSLSLKTAPHGQRGSISIVTVETRSDVITFLELLDKDLSEKNFTRLPKLRVPNKSELDKKGVLVMMLQAIPGVGEEKARKLAEKYNSIAEIVRVDVKELSELVGEKTAVKIKNYLI
ncbi:MAG: helix-hairpin-helix domain-containing protein [Thermosphaera sp.]